MSEKTVDITSPAWSWEEYVLECGFKKVPYIEDVVPWSMMPPSIKIDLALWYQKNGFVFGYSLANPANPYGSVGMLSTWWPDGTFWFMIMHPRRNNAWNFFLSRDDRKNLETLCRMIDAMADPECIPLCVGAPCFSEMFGPELKGGPDV